MTAYELVRVLGEKGPRTVAQLAEEFSVSSRTVRNYVHRTNDLLAGVGSISAGADGRYGLSVTDEDALAGWMERMGPMVAGVAQTPEERQEYLMESLLARGDWVTLDEYAERLFVSRKSVSADLSVVEGRLAGFGLALERRPHYGVRVTGSERDRRAALASCAMRSAGTDGLFAGSLPEGAVEKVADLAGRAMQECGVKVSSFAFQNLVVHIAIALMRFEAGAESPLPASELGDLAGSREHRAARQIARGLEGAFRVALSEDEVAYIAVHFAGRRTVEPDRDAGAGSVSDEAWGLVAEMLDAVHRAYRLDLREDFELRVNLALHMDPLLLRLRYGMSMANPLLADIKGRFSLSYLLALEAARSIEAHCGTMPSDDEVGYLALAFALSLSRDKEVPRERKSILIVCASGAGSARLLESVYRDEFGSYLDRIESCDLSRVSEVDFTGIDYVFTTVPIKEKLPVLVFQVPFFLGTADLSAIRDVLSDGRVADELSRFFDERLFFPHCPALSREETIELLCAETMELVELPENFPMLVLARERVVPSSFGNLAAMPHPIEAVGSQTVVTVALLERSIDWGGHEVQAVFLINVARDGQDDLDLFYRSMARLLMDEAAIRTLVERRDFATLMGLLAQKAKLCRKEG